MRPAKYSPAVILESPRDRDLVVMGLREYAAIIPTRTGAQLAKIHAEHLTEVTRNELTVGYYAEQGIIKRAAVGLESSPSLNPAFTRPGDLGAMACLRSVKNLYRSHRAKQLDSIWRAAGAYEEAPEEPSKYEIR